jgi:hypothetical protein
MTEMRASDTDRERVVDELRRHNLAGRLDLDEYAERVGAALAAETLEDLDRLRRDLPLLRIADPAEHRRAALVGRAAGVGLLGAATSLPGESAGAGWRARLVVLLTVVVIVAGVVAVLAAQALWAVILVAGWVIGVVQGRLGRRG